MTFQILKKEKKPHPITSLAKYNLLLYLFNSLKKIVFSCLENCKTSYQQILHWVLCLVCGYWLKVHMFALTHSARWS